jgi:hypothetical protein
MFSGGRDSWVDRAPTGFDETVTGGIAAANATRRQHPSEGVVGGRTTREPTGEILVVCTGNFKKAFQSE